VPGDELTLGRITLGATSAETGNNADDLDAIISGAPLEIAFNVKYLIEVLSVIGSNQVSLKMTDAASPGVLRIVGDETLTHVIMPMHVGGR
jgi:DNA polymerase-3 subunit beta